MTIVCNIWMICLILIWFFYGLSRMFQFPQFVLALRSSVWDVLNNFLDIDATYRNKISSDQKRFFIALSLYPLSFFANTPFKVHLSRTSSNLGLQGELARNSVRSGHTFWFMFFKRNLNIDLNFSQIHYPCYSDLDLDLDFNQCYDC